MISEKIKDLFLKNNPQVYGWLFFTLLAWIVWNSFAGFTSLHSISEESLFFYKYSLLDAGFIPWQLHVSKWVGNLLDKSSYPVVLIIMHVFSAVLFKVFVDKSPGSWVSFIFLILPTPFYAMSIGDIQFLLIEIVTVLIMALVIRKDKSKSSDLALLLLYFLAIVFEPFFVLVYFIIWTNLKSKQDKILYGMISLFSLVLHFYINKHFFAYKNPDPFLEYLPSSYSISFLFYRYIESLVTFIGGLTGFGLSIVENIHNPILNIFAKLLTMIAVFLSLYVFNLRKIILFFLMIITGFLVYRFANYNSVIYLFLGEYRNTVSVSYLSAFFMTFFFLFNFIELENLKKQIPFPIVVFSILVIISWVNIIPNSSNAKFGVGIGSSPVFWKMIDNDEIKINKDFFTIYGPNQFNQLNETEQMIVKGFDLKTLESFSTGNPDRYVKFYVLHQYVKLKKFRAALGLLSFGLKNQTISQKAFIQLSEDFNRKLEKEVKKVAVAALGEMRFASTSKNLAESIYLLLLTLYKNSDEEAFRNLQNEFKNIFR